jgi:hypothetical protein
MFPYLSRWIFTRSVYYVSQIFMYIVCKVFGMQKFKYVSSALIIFLGNLQYILEMHSGGCNWSYNYHLIARTPSNSHLAVEFVIRVVL